MDAPTLKLKDALISDEALGDTGALSPLTSLAEEYATDQPIAIHSSSVFMAKSFLRALPAGIPRPEFSVEPDGSISLDWIESRNRFFSLSVGVNNQFGVTPGWMEQTRGKAWRASMGSRFPSVLLTASQPS